MLLPNHFEMLAVESAIDDELVQNRGYESVSWTETSRDERRYLVSLGIPKAALLAKEGSGLLIPVYSPLGDVVTHQFRPDIPVEDGPKYYAPFGQTNRLDVHPKNSENIRDVKVPLVITEGVKKADSLASRGQCVVALSGVFNWRNKMGSIGDWEDVILKGREVIICFDSDARDNLMVLMAMERLRNWLVARGAKKVQYLIVPKFCNAIEVKGADDWFAAGGTWNDLLENASLTINDHLKTDSQFSEAILVDKIADDILEGEFVYTRSLEWLHYTGKVWEPVEESVVIEHVRQYVLDQYEIACNNEKQNSNTENQQAKAGWGKYLAAHKLRALVKLCMGIQSLRRHESDFDSNPDVINCQNGLLDLRTGELSPHSPKDMCMKITNVDYNPDARSENWNKALEAIPMEVRNWTMIRYGQAITGHMPDDDILLIEYGNGANGKSTIVDGIRLALGNYYRLISNNVLLAASKGSELPTEAMDLMGLRFAQLEETPEARRLDVNKMKQFVGTSQITARPLYKASVTFNATHTLFITTNNIPIVNETDHGSWRRLALLEYPYKFVRDASEIQTENDRLGDNRLKYKIRESKEAHEAVFAWLVEGARYWYRNGQVMPSMPAKVVKDTNEWRQNSDTVLRYIDERLVFDTEGIIATRDMLVDINEWLKESGKGTWSIENMSNKFLNHDAVIENNIVKKQVLGAKVTSISRWKTDFGNRPWCFVGVRFKKEGDV